MKACNTVPNCLQSIELYGTCLIDIIYTNVNSSASNKRSCV